MRPFVVRRRPGVTYSVLHELKRRRGALRSALAGRSEKSLIPIIRFINNSFNDMKYAAIAIEIAEELLGKWIFWV